MKPFLHLQSVDEVEKRLFAFPVLESERVFLPEAVGRRLAQPFYAPANLPGFARSTMDGYALNARDSFGASESSPALFEIAGQCHMGELPGFVLKPGETGAIPTGAPLPSGADAVAMIEYCRDTGHGQVEITRPVSPGMHVVGPDEDARKGQLLVPAGKLLRPQECGIFAAFGVEQVDVVRRPRVAIFSSGDEITPIDIMPPAGKLRDVNSWTLDALCRTNGANPMRMGILNDSPDSMAVALREALALVDVIVISGGSSAGMRDHTVEALLSLPESRVLVHGVAISPGKPFILASSGKKPLLGLPGHVTSALVCGHVFLAPLLCHLQGLEKEQPKPWLDSVLTRSVVSAQGRREYIRCRLEKRGDGFHVTPILAPSALLIGLLEADGYIICPENSEGLAQGEKVRFYPF